MVVEPPSFDAVNGRAEAMLPRPLDRSGLETVTARTGERPSVRPDDRDHDHEPDPQRETPERSAALAKPLATAQRLDNPELGAIRRGLGPETPDRQGFRALRRRSDENPFALVQSRPLVQHCLDLDWLTANGPATDGKSSDKFSEGPLVRGRFGMHRPEIASDWLG
jgi:hypothetical protein